MTELNKHKCKKQLIFFVENALVAKETSVLKKMILLLLLQAFCICKNAMAKRRRSRATAAAYCKTVGLNSD